MPGYSTAGALLSISTGFLWSLAPLFWSSVGRHIGSFRVNLLRILLATGGLLVILPVYAMFRGGWPDVPSAHQALWLVLSAAAGMVVGDLCFYEAVVQIGPRRAVQTNTLAPVSSVVVAWFWLGETLTLQTMSGITLVLASITYIAYVEMQADPEPTREPGRMSLVGLIFGIASAVFVGLGAVLARQAFLEPGPLDPIMATVVRVASACVMLWTFPLTRGKGADAIFYLRVPRLRLRIILGTLAGPLVGMLFYVGALKYAPAGLVSTLSSTSPLFILPIVAVKYRARITADVYIATIAAIAGVGIIFWKP